jgi:hypothetical protein
MVAANSQWLVSTICCTCNGNNPTERTSSPSVSQELFGFDQQSQIGHGVGQFSDGFINGEGFSMCENIEPISSPMDGVMGLPDIELETLAFVEETLNFAYQ